MDDSDRRDFPRIRSSVSVRYKFISSTVKDAELENVFEGTTVNLSLGGLLLLGPVVRMDWIKDLLLGHIQVGVNIEIPLAPKPVKALTRLSWIEARDPDAMSFRMGLRILDLPAESRSMLSDFLAREARIP